MSLRRARCFPHFFVSHDYYLVRFTSVSIRCVLSLIQTSAAIDHGPCHRGI